MSDVEKGKVFKTGAIWNENVLMFAENQTFQMVLGKAAAVDPRNKILCKLLSIFILLFGFFIRGLKS